MGLSEPQILRYSRQILLRDVGGEGQARLLARTVEPSGAGGALADALAYLGAGGTPVAVCDGEVLRSEVGALFAREAVGTPRRGALKAALRALGEDALCAPPGPGGSLAQAPARPSGEAPWVWVGRLGEGGALVARSAQGCEACFHATLQAIPAEPAEPGSPLDGALGALAALAFQHAVLGQGAALKAVRLHADGRCEALPLARCGRCG